MDMSTLMIHQELRRRLDRLAKRMGVSTNALANSGSRLRCMMKNAAWPVISG